MTAEIAILNKSAVALAADSAVTISAGSDQHKVFDSADKLFEMCKGEPIAAMINGGMNFVQIPLGILVKKFRSQDTRFKKVADASEAFLKYLNEYAETASAAVIRREVSVALQPILEIIKDRFDDRYLTRYFGDDGNIDPQYIGEDGLARARADELTFQLQVMRAYLEHQPDAEFVGGVAPKLDDELATLSWSLFKHVLPDLSKDHTGEAAAICLLAIKKVTKIQGSTGLVIAGYGSDELFPTLVSFEIRGAPCGRLRFSRVHHVDIDRDGDRARVIPFAQREMVERFLYGLDEDIQRDISQFCRSSVPSISKSIIDRLEMSQAEKDALAAEATNAEAEFLAGLTQKSFDAIRQQSQAEIEDMVEFMPKPEMARMAEALVNLTSIKRRVSRGMETVGGPIDVLMISQSEGLVWVKRKHYFPPELNSRFFNRIR